MSEEQAPPPSADNPRRIKSFVTRPGRMGSGQIKALKELAPRYVLPHQSTPPEWDAVFGRQAPRVLEIGFGMGDATAKIAATLPHIDFIACEVHVAGVGSLLQRIEEAQLTNLRIVQHDAVEVLWHMVPKASLHGVHPPFIADLVQYIAPGGYFHAATDWEPYAQQMLEVLSAEPALRNTAEGFAEQPSYRPQTKFEARGLRLGHGVWDLVFERR